MDLADELMNDLENDSGSEFDFDGEGDEAAPEAGPSTSADQADDNGDAVADAEAELGEEMVVPEGGVRPAEELDQAAVDAMELGPGAVRSVEQVAKLAASRTMRDVLQVGPY